MTNDEMRIAIGKLRGFDVAISPSATRDHLWFQLFKDGERYSTNSYLVEDKAWRDAPNWPENIADAWELWEELPPFKSIEYHAPMNRPYSVMYTVGNTHHQFDADTAPLAICVAWLAWEGVGG